MRSIILSAVATLLMIGLPIVAALGGIAASKVPSTKGAAIPVPLEEIRDKGVMGQLGVPLGTMVTVAGSAVPNNSKRKADAEEPLFLRITSVDGKQLDKPVDYPFRKAADFIDVGLPKVGDTFEFRGFETGRYSGVPLNYGAPWQTTGFCFSTEFLILPPK